MRPAFRRPRPLRFVPPGSIPEPPPWVTKADFACCVAARDRDPLGRFPVGDCGPECQRKAWRREWYGS